MLKLNFKKMAFGWLVMVLVLGTVLRSQPSQAAAEKQSPQTRSAKKKQSQNPQKKAVSVENSDCLPNTKQRLKKVTHYYTAMLKKYNKKICKKVEGSCIVTKSNGKQTLYNAGMKSRPIEESRCKNGFGNVSNCLHPCRTVAASMDHHRVGEVLYIPSLKGRSCQGQKHDGYVVVADTGSPKHFNQRGRLDFFWGRCTKFAGGVCGEGAAQIADAISSTPYCVVWDPRKPLVNTERKLEFSYELASEAINRGDQQAADEFDLDALIGPAARDKWREAARRQTDRNKRQAAERRPWPKSAEAVFRDSFGR